MEQGVTAPRPNLRAKPLEVKGGATGEKWDILSLLQNENVFEHILLNHIISPSLCPSVISLVNQSSMEKIDFTQLLYVHQFVCLSKTLKS